MKHLYARSQLYEKKNINYYLPIDKSNKNKKTHLVCQTEIHQL